MRIVKEVVKHLESSRKVNKQLVSEKEVNDFLHTCDCINNLPWEARRLGDYLLDEYSIASKLSLFIKPSRVSVGTGRKYNDLLIRNGSLDYTEDGNVLTPDEFWRVSQKICNQGRWDCNLVSVPSLRVEKLLTEVEDMICEDGFLPFTDRVDFMPIEVNVDVFNEDEYSKRISSYYTALFSVVFN